MALTWLSEAARVVETTDARVSEAELLYRVPGDLLNAAGARGVMVIASVELAFLLIARSWWRRSSIRSPHFVTASFAPWLMNVAVPLLGNVSV
jgi:hypothetical protein